jgi:hypothetical protein
MALHTRIRRAGRAQQGAGTVHRHLKGVTLVPDFLHRDTVRCPAPREGMDKSTARQADGINQVRQDSVEAVLGQAPPITADTKRSRNRRLARNIVP